MPNKLKIPEPKKNYRKYLSQTNVKKFENLNLEKIKIVFKSAFRDFLYGKISTEDFSMLCSRLIFCLSKEEKKKEENMFHALLAGSELRYAVRNLTLSAYIREYLEDVYKYFELKE